MVLLDLFVYVSFADNEHQVCRYCTGVKSARAKSNQRALRMGSMIMHPNPDILEG